MSRVAILGLAGGAILPALVGAEEIKLASTVAPACSFSESPQISGASTMTVHSLSKPLSQLSITSPTTPAGLARNWGFTFSIDATCNSPSQVTLSTLNGGLKGAPAPSGGFTNFIDYYAITSWPPGLDSNVNLFTTGVAATAEPSAAAAAQSGPLQVQVGWNGAGSHSGLPLLAGDYTDTLTVSLVPQ